MPGCTEGAGCGLPPALRALLPDEVVCEDAPDVLAHRLARLGSEGFERLGLGSDRPTWTREFGRRRSRDAANTLTRTLFHQRPERKGRPELLEVLVECEPDCDQLSRGTEITWNALQAQTPSKDPILDSFLAAPVAETRWLADPTTNVRQEQRFTRAYDPVFGNLTTETYHGPDGELATECDWIARSCRAEKGTPASEAPRGPLGRHVSPLRGAAPAPPGLRRCRPGRGAFAARSLAETTLPPAGLASRGRVALLRGEPWDAQAAAHLPLQLSQEPLS